MAYQGSDAAGTETRRNVFIGVGVVAALLLAAVFYIATRPAAMVEQARLEGAVVRAGDASFEQVKEQVRLDSKEASESPRAVGDIVMTLEATVRNFTGRTINGLEVRGAVVDSAGNPVRERTVIVLPSGQTRQTELAPNNTLPARIMLEGFKQSDDRADTRMEIVGVRFK